MAIADEIKKRYGNILEEYDPRQNTPYTIVDPIAGNNNTIDVNTLSEGAVDDLIRQYGGQGQLLGRKSFLQAGRELKEGTEKEEAINKDTALKQEIERALGQNVDRLYNNAADFAGSAIERQFAPTRAKAMSEEAALGRLGSPVSAYTTGRLNDAQANALGDTVRGLATQRAAGETDLAKYLQTVLAGERRAGEEGDRFNQTFDLNKNQFQSKLNEAAAGRAWDREKFQAEQTQNREANEEDLMDKIARGARTASSVSKAFNDTLGAGGNMAYLSGGGGSSGGDKASGLSTLAKFAFI